MVITRPRWTINIVIVIEYTRAKKRSHACHGNCSEIRTPDFYRGFSLFLSAPPSQQLRGRELSRAAARVPSPPNRKHEYSEIVYGCPESCNITAVVTVTLDLNLKKKKKFSRRVKYVLTLSSNRSLLFIFLKSQNIQSTTISIPNT